MVCKYICRSEERQFVPAVDQYFEDAMMAADPANQIEDAYKYVNTHGGHAHCSISPSPSPSPSQCRILGLKPYCNYLYLAEM